MIRIAFLLLSFAACRVASAQSDPVDLRDATSIASIEQIGTLNLATIAQTASSATLVQAGASNDAQIEQVGLGSHRVVLSQEGESVATVLQSGEGNGLFGLAGWESSAIQTGRSELHLVQTGMDNTALVSQAAGAYASLTQTGAGNTIIAMQTR